MNMTEERQRQMKYEVAVVSRAIERQKSVYIDAGDVRRATNMGALCAGVKAMRRRLELGMESV